MLELKTLPHLRLERRGWVGAIFRAGRHDCHISAIVAQVQEALCADLAVLKALARRK